MRTVPATLPAMHSPRSEPAPTAAAPAPAADRGPVQFLAILLVAAALRPAVSSVGPVLPEIEAELGLSSVGAALLTSLPVLCFGLLAPIAPRLGRRLGVEPTLGVVVAAIVLGLLLRLGPEPITLYAGTILAGGAIALANVLMPSLVRREFPRHVGLMTGVYTGAMTIASTVAAAATVPLSIASGLGWRGGLGFWALPAGIALLAWLPQVRDHSRPPAVPGAGRSLLRDRLAWAVTLFMGLQSLLFYASIAWLPSVYREEGFSPTDAGLLLSSMTLVAIPAGLVVSALAGRARSQARAAAGATLLGMIGLIGLLLAPSAAPLLWSVVLGAGMGMTFPLALTMIALRSGSVEVTARLSAMAQAVGYALAALGPLAVGLLHDASGGWSVPLGLLLILGLAQTGVGLVAGRAGTVRA